MKLALAPRLGPLVAKHRPAVPEPLGPLGQQAVLNGGPHHRSGALRPQGAAAIAAIDEGVHLLADHIGGLADAAGKQLGGLQQRRADLADGSAAKVLAGRRLKLLPEGGVLRQQINHAAQALERCQGIESQRSLVCLGTRQGSGGELGWGLSLVPAASPHRPQLLGSLRDKLRVGRDAPPDRKS